jgi:hypothetical protein
LFSGGTGKAAGRDWGWRALRQDANANADE